MHSVIRRYCVETAEHIIKLFSPPDSYTILVFFTLNFMAILRQRSPMGVSNAWGMKKSRDVRPIFGFISEMIPGMAIVTVECE